MRVPALDWGHIGAIAFAVAGLLSGLRAAQLWYKASNVDSEPYGANWLQSMEPNAVGALAGLQLALQEAGKLNAKAAAWTAASVIASGTSALLGAL
jgi:hypothetical protein